MERHTKQSKKHHTELAAEPQTQTENQNSDHEKNSSTQRTPINKRNVKPTSEMKTQTENRKTTRH
jgi:hypothetical protein